MVRVADTEVDLLAERAVHWPEAATLLVADLHWGKGETFRGAGLPVPRGELADDLGRLGRALRRTGARRLVVLGDLVHGRIGVTDDVVATVTAWRREWRGSFLLVRGNHDRHLPEVPEGWGIEAVEGVVREGPFAFCHHPTEIEGFYAWSGHVHPTVRLGGRADGLRLPCFRLGRRSGVLPAFGTFTGGPSVRGFTRGDERLFAVAGDRVIAV